MGSFFGSRFKRDFKILITGVEGSGKTSLLYRLKYNKKLFTVPTFGFNIEIIPIEDAKFLTFDIGRMDDRDMNEFFPETDVVMWVVDSADMLKMSLSRIKLKELMKNEELKDSFLMVIANKQDLNEAVSTTEIIKKLNLVDIDQNWSVFSAVSDYSSLTEEDHSREDKLISDIKNYLLTYVVDNFLNETPNRNRGNNNIVEDNNNNIQLENNSRVNDDTRFADDKSHLDDLLKIPNKYGIEDDNDKSELNFKDSSAKKMLKESKENNKGKISKFDKENEDSSDSSIKYKMTK